MFLLLDTLLEYLSTTHRLVGIIIAAVGVALCLLSKKITRVVRKDANISGEDKLYLTLLGVSLTMILAGMIVSIL